MTFETKFNYGQNAYMIFKDKIIKVNIRGISIDFVVNAECNPDIYIKYEVFEYTNGWELVNIVEEKLFASKEELLEKLTNEAKYL